MRGEAPDDDRPGESSGLSQVLLQARTKPAAEVPRGDALGDPVLLCAKGLDLDDVSEVGEAGEAGTEVGMRLFRTAAGDELSRGAVIS